jgi:hypothetical protein
LLPYCRKTLKTSASTTAPLHYTTPEKLIVEHHSLSSPPAITGGQREDVPPVLQHPIDEALQNKVKKKREK